MGKCYSTDHIAKDHIHTDITCNTKEPQKKNRLGTVSYRLLRGGGGGVNWFYRIQTSLSASTIVLPNQTITTNLTDQHVTVNHLRSAVSKFRGFIKMAYMYLENKENLM